MSLQLSGLVGGLVATIVMTAFMMALGDDSPPPTAVLWSKYVGDGPPEEYVVQGMVLHLLYGVGAGWVFALVGVAGLYVVGSVPLGLVNGLVNGVVYGLVLLAVAAVVWMRGVLGIEADPGEMGPFVLFHVVYGVVLGAWVGLGILV